MYIVYTYICMLKSLTRLPIKSMDFAYLRNYFTTALTNKKKALSE